jgi:hypothetical protein
VFLLLSHFSTTLINSYEIVDALDRNVWDSSVLVHSHMCLGAPYMCEFTNTYVDFARIYLVPKPNFIATAAVDLYNCCKDVFLLSDVQYSCNSSVKRSLCSCVSGYVAMPSIWTKNQYQNVLSPVQNFTGNTWLMKLHIYLKNVYMKLKYICSLYRLMNHYVASHHPDHFNMRLLEVHNMVAIAKQGLHAECYQNFPKTIDNMLSMDYPNDRTDYEILILKIVQRQINVSFTSLNINTNWAYYLSKEYRNQTIYEPFANALEELSPQELENVAGAEQLRNLSMTSYNKVQSFSARGRSKTAHLEKSFYSTAYKNNFPPPKEYSREITRASVRAVLAAHAAELGSRTHCVSKNVSSKHMEVAILQRIDGNGMRRFINLDAVARTVQSVLRVSSLRILYIDGKTPPIDQAAAFCSVHLIISPHSSQLTNLIFSGPKIALIELQPPLERFDTSFKDLAHSLGFYYQVFGNEIYPRPKTEDERIDRMKIWRREDMIANITELHKALVRAQAHLRQEGYIV